ncbi:MAG: hypothetical protein IJB05_01115 [Bacteroidales bacterium]|nr:hypothetical protein [Bacteroidales bacterium]
MRNAAFPEFLISGNLHKKMAQDFPFHLSVSYNLLIDRQSRTKDARPPIALSVI